VLEGVEDEPQPGRELLGGRGLRLGGDQLGEVVGVCREQSVDKLDELADRITVVAGRTNDRDVVRWAVAGCDDVLTVLVPWGVEGDASGTARAVLDFADPGGPPA
jgi:hypothetical protein